MARGRMISKTLSTSRKFAALANEFHQVLYVLMVSHADDFGRQSGDAFTVKHQVFPTSPRAEADFETAITALETNGLIERYQMDDESVIQIIGFDQHQVGLHKRSSSRFPDNPGTSGNFPEIPSEFKGRELNLIEPKGREGASPLVMSPSRYAKLRESHAFVGARLRVPNVLHDELRTKIGGNGETKLQAWYLALDAEVEASGEAVPDVFAWLRPRFVAWCQAQGLVKAPVSLATAFASKGDGRDLAAVDEALRTRQRRAEMTEAGMDPAEVEAVFEREYLERKQEANR